MDSPPSAEPDRPAPDLRATGERIEALLDASSAGGVKARERAEELLRLVTDLYGAGLERFMDLLYDTGRLDDELLGLLAEDDLVASLLLVHGLHPYGVEQRVEQALERVRPYLGSHGGDVELLGVDAEGVVRLRLLGSCDGCPSSSVTLKLAVEDAIEAAAPEVVAIQVEEATAPHADAPGPLIPVDSLRTRLDAGAGGGAGGTWHALTAAADLAAGGATTTTVADTRLLLCRVGADLFAFRDRCARCEAGLADAVLARRLGGEAGDAVLRCPSCGAHYDVRRAGACLDAPDLHLDPLPLLADGPTVSVALPAPVA
jgi:Fe-S cluster biogenesis protein NfuA/nitrite reductase/ring-hydroxylating ferredoxin subunit